MKKFFGVIVFVLMIACNRDCNLIPLNNEYEWVYKTTWYNANGSIKDTITDTTKVINTIDNNGNTYYNLGLLLPLRNKDCNTISLLFDAATNKEILIRTNVDANKTELFNQPFTGTPTDCFVGTKIIGYKDRFNINGHSCFRSDELFNDCSGKVFKRVEIYIAEKIGVVKISSFDAMPSGKEALQFTQDLVSYNFLVEQE